MILSQVNHEHFMLFDFTICNDFFFKLGRVNAKKIVCIVFDEAHRATKNYAYTKVVNLN